MTWVELCAPEEEIALARRIQAGDLAARNELVERNMPMVLEHMRRSGLGHDDDVRQAGSIGLMRAADRFDPGRGLRFSTYAMHWVRMEIGRVLKGRRMVRLPAYLTYKPPADRPSAARYQAHAARTAVVRSLNVVAPDESAPQVVDHRWEGAWEATERAESIEAVRSCLAALPPRQRLVLTRRLGLDGAAPAGLSRVAAEMQISKEGVRQIECRALRLLAAMMGSDRKPVTLCKAGGRGA